MPLTQQMFHSRLFGLFLQEKHISQLLTPQVTAFHLQTAQLDGKSQMSLTKVSLLLNVCYEDGQQPTSSFQGEYKTQLA